MLAFPVAIVFIILCVFLLFVLPFYFYRIYFVLTPFHVKCLHRRYDDLLKSLESGEDINQVDRNGETALMLAVRQNDYEMVRFLVKHGADIAIRNPKGDTALNLTNSSTIPGIKQRLTDQFRD